ncbi:GNAT family N-acetyltransferase [Arthrobacter sp. Soc17.1.1.1]|uniref:GNAT family N-acetyltransferase n=1 Tax=Arthrobacter sp. Soc17.1.1.1 TaxID=3121277 RepID=UPI002FE4A0F6
MALAQGNVRAAQSFVGQTLPDYFASTECKAFCSSPEPQECPQDALYAYTSQSAGGIAQRAKDNSARLILDYEHQRIVGLITFTSRAVHPGIVCVGLAIDPKRRRQGYGKAALRIAMDTARAAPNIQALHVVVPAGHTVAAHSVLFGFTPLSSCSDNGPQRWSLTFA